MKIKNEIKQYRNKPVKVLYQDLANAYNRLQSDKFSTKFRKLKDISQIRKNRQSIARILTVIKEKLIKKSER